MDAGSGFGVHLGGFGGIGRRGGVMVNAKGHQTRRVTFTVTNSLVINYGANS